MAKSRETFNKKEKEKKRLKNKQDKKQKLEDRKANKRDGRSLESMMAYLDENGNLTDTPPDPTRKREISLEEIQIGVPKQEHIAPDQPRQGVVAFFNKSKGFGFIKDHITQEQFFFHINDTLNPIDESDKVSYFVERGPRGMNAVQVNKIT